MSDFTIYNNQPTDIALHGRGMVDVSRTRAKQDEQKETPAEPESGMPYDGYDMATTPEIEQFINSQFPQSAHTMPKSGGEGREGLGPLPGQLSLFDDEDSQDAKKAPAEKKTPTGPVTITVLHTNDIHGNILPKTEIVSGNSMDGTTEQVEFGGEPVLASLISKEREEAARRGESLLLLDAGDMFMGTSISGLFDGKPVLEIMNREGYDAAAVGNHDFDWGTGKYEDLIQNANFPFLAANALGEDGKPLTHVKPFIIKELPGVKVGIVGLASPETNEITCQDDVKKMKFEDPVETLRRTVPQMREQGAELIIVLSHAGLDQDVRVATELKEQNIVLIVGGHSHNALQEPVKIGDTIVAQTGAGGVNLGKVQLQWDPESKQVINSSGTLNAAGVFTNTANLPSTRLTFSGTLAGGGWEDTQSVIRGSWTGGDYDRFGNLMPGWKTSGPITISMPSKNTVRLIRTNSGYGYVFNATGMVLGGGTAVGSGNWGGRWNTSWGAMILTQTGNRVTGSYTHKDGKIDGTVSGNVCSGTWTQSNAKGAFRFVMASNGKSFKGGWNYDHKGPLDGNWEGSR